MRTFLPFLMLLSANVAAGEITGVFAGADVQIMNNRGAVGEEGVSLGTESFDFDKDASGRYFLRVEHDFYKVPSLRFVRGMNALNGVGSLSRSPSSFGRVESSRNRHIDLAWENKYLTAYYQLDDIPWPFEVDVGGSIVKLSGSGSSAPAAYSEQQIGFTKLLPAVFARVGLLDWYPKITADASIDFTSISGDVVVDVEARIKCKVINEMLYDGYVYAGLSSTEYQVDGADGYDAEMRSNGVLVGLEFKF